MKKKKAKKVLCVSCGKPIHIDEFGGIVNNGMIHNNYVCLYKHIKKNK